MVFVVLVVATEATATATADDDDAEFLIEIEVDRGVVVIVIIIIFYNPMDSIILYSTTNYNNIISPQFTSHATVRSYHYITVIQNESKSILIQNCIIIIKEYRSSRP